MENKLLKEIEPVLNMFIVGRTFKVSELFDPVIWENKTLNDKMQVAKEFFELLSTELKSIVEIVEDNYSNLLKIYKKVGNGLLKKAVNVFPDEPVTVKRNERGNA
ncbi:MAG TPA: hypothetical protein GX708_18840 [Gallicola sp.]|nr:hypothetical protein [Gallicola sp.]